MVTAIAGLEEGIISGDTYVTCTGTYEYGGQTFRCNNHDTPMTLNVTGCAQILVQFVLLHGRSEADR